jgi:predicted nucleic acid-binding protein
VSPRGRPNVVDSSAWLSYLAGEASAKHFSGAIEDAANLVVPTVCLLEVFKVIARQRGDGDALQAVALMQQSEVVPLDSNLAILAAKVSVESRLPLADSVVYATALHAGAVLWTQDNDFDGLPDVKYYPKKTG